MPKTSSPPKRMRLTLAQLASHDDILTDLLVDNAYYWCKIRKNREKYTPSRKFKKDEIRNILFDEIILGDDVACAEERLLQLRGVQDYLNRWKNHADKEHFKRHLRKYINIWQPDCPWEVGTTNRYTILTFEAAAFARRPIKKGEVIKYLCGTLVLMTPEEEKQLDISRTDFSIVRSSRRKASALFLGPARFSNHDCNANAALSTRGSDGMVVIATRNIGAGDEITVTYGEDYFGIDNCECLCRTCEERGRNGWAAGSAVARDASVAVTEELEIYTRELSNSTRSKRSRESSAAMSSFLASPDPEAILAKRRKLTPSPLSQNSRPESSQPETADATPKARTEETEDRQRAADPQPGSFEKMLPQGQSQETDTSTVVSVSVPEPITHTIDTASAILIQPEHMTAGAERPLEEDFPMEPDPPEQFQAVFRSKIQDMGEMSRVASSIASRRSDEVELIFDPHEYHEPSETGTPGSFHIDHIQPPDKDDDLCQSRIMPQTIDFVIDTDAPLAQDLENEDEPALPTIEQADSKMNMDRETVNEASNEIPDVAENEIVNEVGNEAEEIQIEPHTADAKTLEVAVAEKVLDELPKNPDIKSDSTPEESGSELSDLASDEELDDNRGTIKKRKKALKMKRAKKMVIPSIEEPKPTPGVRYPGDYIRTKELLAHPGSIWADCQTCNGTWVQIDAHETHRECPRCERHSIIYGYSWPKTEQRSGDPDRVRDHRTINRILAPDEQRNLKRRGRGLEGTPSGSISRRESPAQFEELAIPRDGRRRSGRRSRIY